ncbi:hypothetical protein NVP1168O_16 [Vibrio phage 1.168.O._10N.261.52.A10]|nr:hypothetical protein NVP1168O_16 [Vibrio phage 1.168.O._10N.261.52.A10]
MRVSIAKDDTTEIEIFVDGEAQKYTVASFISPEVRRAVSDYPEEEDFHHVLASAVIDWNHKESLADIIKDYDALGDMIYGASMLVTNRIKESKKT